MKLTGFSLKGQALVGSLWNPQPDLPQSQHRLGMDKRMERRGRGLMEHGANVHMCAPVVVCARNHTAGGSC